MPDYAYLAMHPRIAKELPAMSTPDSKDEGTRKPRLDSVDVLRTIAIVAMLLCHFVIYTSRPGEGAFPWLNFVADQIIGNWPAALFLFISGASFAISLNKQEASGKSPAVIRNRALRRGLAIFGVGLLFELCVWSPGDLFDWDVLTTIASSLLILYALRRVSARTLYTLAALTILVSPILFRLCDGGALWAKEDDFDPPFTPRGILVGYLVAGYFPLLPWVSYALVGYGMGRRYLVQPSGEVERVRLATTGATLLGLGLGLALVAKTFPLGETLGLYVSQLHFYPVSPSLFLLNMGLVVLLFSYAHTVFDVNAKPNAKLGFFRVISRYALTIYVAHHVLLVVPQRIAGVWMEGDQFAFVYTREVIPPPIAEGMAILSIPLFYLLCKLWDRKKGRFSLEWLIGKVAG
jgi:uncharacterized membrane protein